MEMKHMTLRDRIAALQEPSPQRSDYGDHECGCTWDSGPFSVYCSKHNSERLHDDVYSELLAAAREALAEGVDERLREAVEVVDLLAKAKPGVD